MYFEDQGLRICKLSFERESLFLYLEVQGTYIKWVKTVPISQLGSTSEPYK